MEEVCVKIRKGLYLGNYKTSMSNFTLSKNNITHILCVGFEMNSFFNGKYKFLKLEVSDTYDENILLNFELVYDFIEDGIKNGGVLVHCFGGISRSSTIIIAYLIKKEKIDFKFAFYYVKNLKNDINPNEGFIKQLKVFDKINNRKLCFNLNNEKIYMTTKF